MASDADEKGWVTLPPFDIGIHESWNLMVYMDVTAKITHRYFKVGKQVNTDGKYRYFIEQGSEGERTYGEWHDAEGKG